MDEKSVPIFQDVTPYIWLINVDGDITVKGNMAEVDTNLFEIIDQSEPIFAFEGRFEASKGIWGGFLDLTYVDIGMDAGVGSFCPPRRRPTDRDSTARAEPASSMTPRQGLF